MAAFRPNLQNLGKQAVTHASPVWAAVRTQTSRQVVDEALLNDYAQSHGLAVEPARALMQRAVDSFISKLRRTARIVTYAP